MPIVNLLGLSTIATQGVARINSLGQGIATTLDPSNLRKSAAGIGLVGGPSVPPAKVNWVKPGNQNSSTDNDWRIKVSLSDSANIFYLATNTGTDSAILQPLVATGGVVFPITPQLQISHTARYSSTPLTHSNYAMQFYEGSEAGSIMLNGEFPIQTISEGQYLLAAIYFFRAATKMFWGSENLAGTPPPMVFLDGYGEHYFPHVPCVVTNVMHTLPDSVDYIDVPIRSIDGQYNYGSTRLPLQSTLQVTLQPIYSRNSLTQFTLSDFAAGRMVYGGFM
jgi:hypothetical protein